MRAFVAVSCGEHLTAELTTVRDRWRDGPLGHLPLRWTDPGSWHLTLQFLSDWPETRLEGLKKALEAGTFPEPFVLHPGKLDAFPSLDAPRVLFLHMGDDGQIAALAARVREIVAGVWGDGPQDTRAFRPHLTLARIREKLPQDGLKLLKNMELENLPPVPVEGFRLMTSLLRPQGAQHVEQAYFALRK